MHKWLPCFENVTAVVFIASLSVYDQMLYEDESVVCLPVSPHRVPCILTSCAELDAGGADTVRLDPQLALVREDVNHRISEQDRSVREEAAAQPARPLLPGLQRRR